MSVHQTDCDPDPWTVDNGENWVSAVLGTCDEIFRHMVSVAYREEPKRKKTCLNRRLARQLGRGKTDHEIMI